ncbi:SDR family oxidoreductase [Microbacterium invictum]|uniref:Uncharacterized protein YbjT (DUF2867 family) n=1 Tax=Microbacterium invictum TaxID=515415 RepID=A0AA40SR46_9MICO|nr:MULTISPECIES: NAD(P)H-binding protein [Microbacterium]MBB4140856.1 uncharacterized protein YbjT (DUF2867 family) [Microbacterium invictum]
MSRIIVIGGTGMVGRRIVTRLTRAGHDAIAAAPSTGVDAVSGRGLAETLHGADVVVDVSKPRTYEPAAVRSHFTTVTTNLLAAGRAAGVGHHVMLAAVGTDRHPAIPYYQAKAAAERLIARGGVPFTLVHATQFMEFAPAIADDATHGDRIRLPHTLVQPIAADDIAAAVARVADQPALDGVIEFAGPDRLPLVDFVRAVLEPRHDPRRIDQSDDGLYFGAHIDVTELLPGPCAFIAPTRFDHWLHAHRPSKPGMPQLRHLLHHHPRLEVAS